MSRTKRLISIILSGALLLTGFVLGRVMGPSNANAADDHQAALAASAAEPNPSPAVANPAQPDPSSTVASESQFYLSDYKTGYADGYQAGLTGQGPNLVNTTRAGYQEGFKKGFSDGYQAQVGAPAELRATTSNTAFARPVVYRRAPRSARRRNSKLKTALTIAAPAAIGAGVGAIAGGKKGAGAGALIGGGAGALYHLIKNRD